MDKLIKTIELEESGFNSFIVSKLSVKSTVFGIIVLAKKEVGTYLYDGSLVLGNLMNAAESLGVASIWIHRAKEEFESDFGKALLKKLGISGEYEGIGHCALGYAAEAPKAPAPRKPDYVYYI